MAISKRDDRGGRWMARVVGLDGKQRAKLFDRKTDAVRWEAEQKLAMAKQEWVDPREGKIRFTAFYEAWAARQVWVPGTTKAMSLAVRSTTFAEIPIARIRRTHVEQWVRDMADRELAPSTIKTRFNNVRSVFRAAVRDRVIGVDPTEGVVLPRQRRREAAMAIPTVDQLRALLAAAGDDFAPFLALSMFAGLRLGEAAGVQVGDIDFLRRQLHVKRQIQRSDREHFEIRRPKYGSERTVYLPDELVKILARHCEDLPAEWLFYGEGTDPPHQNTVGYRARKAFERAGVTGFTLHSLRHAFASHLIQAGADVVTVQRAMGHASAATTLRIYAHWFPSAEDRTRQAAAGMMSAILTPESHHDLEKGR